MSLLMTILIAAFKSDLAAANIADMLIKKYSFDETGESSAGKPVYRKNELRLVYLEVDDIYADNLDQSFETDTIIFASRHKSESGEPTLTTHISGNLTSEARFGGKPKRLALAHANLMKAALIALKSAKERLGLARYLVSVEATHHGPTELRVPSIFVEIGSSEMQWRDEKAAEAVADAIYSSATKPASGKPAVGFGGGHYSPKHTQVNLAEEYAVGHILPKYYFDSFDPSMVQLAFDRTVGVCKTAIIDWKGVRGPERRRLVEFLDDRDITVVRV